MVYKFIEITIGVNAVNMYLEWFRQKDRHGDLEKHCRGGSTKSADRHSSTLEETINTVLSPSPRAQDLKAKKHHIPLVDRTPLEPPPIVVVVVGPPKVGKSTLIRCLIKNFTRQKLGDICGPVTIVSGELSLDVSYCIEINWVVFISAKQFATEK